MGYEWEHNEKYHQLIIIKSWFVHIGVIEIGLVQQLSLEVGEAS